jgi:hypothetical protein
LRNGSITPAQAGVQLLPLVAGNRQPRKLDPGLRRGDEKEMTHTATPREPITQARRKRPRGLRTLAFWLLAVALPPAAFAMDARWTVLHEDAGGGGYIDLASVQRSDGFADVWMLVDYAEPRSIRGVRKSQSNSALAKVRIDCAGRKSGILALELRADRHGEGELVFQHSIDAPEMLAVQTDPDMIKALELVCGQQR